MKRVRALKGHNPEHLLQLSILGEPLMLQVKLPVLGTIYTQSNNFVTGVGTKAMGDLKHNDSPD